MKKIYIYLLIFSVIVLSFTIWYSYKTNKDYQLAQHPVLKTKVDEKSLPSEYLSRYVQRAAVYEYAAEKSLAKPRNKKTEQELSTDYKIWYKLGRIRKMLNDYQGAAGAWIEAGKLTPENSAPFANLADLYTYFLKDYKKAEEAYLKAIHLFPTVEFYRNFADFYRVSQPDNPSRAEEVILQGLKVYPEHRDLLGYLASYFRETGQKQKAIEYYERLIKVDPDHPSAKQDLEQLKAQ